MMKELDDLVNSIVPNTVAHIQPTELKTKG